MDISRGIPKKLTPDLIVDSVIEIRFASEYPESAVFGLVFDRVKTGYPNYKSTNIPAEIRQQDIGLRYFPEAYISNDDFTIGLSKNSLVVGGGVRYKGWETYSAEINRLIAEVLTDERLMVSIDRIGLRYINFFEGISMVDQIADLNVTFNNMTDYARKASSYRLELNKGDIGYILNCADNASYNGNPQKGCIVDIDAYYSSVPNRDRASIVRCIETLHVEEKKLFFSLLKDEAVNARNPEYEEV